MPHFEGMPCFEIAHHHSTEGMMVLNPKYKYKQRGEKDTRRKDEKRASSVSTSHPIHHLRH
jgi:hypothetical protein